MRLVHVKTEVIVIVVAEDRRIAIELSRQTNGMPIAVSIYPFVPGRLDEMAPRISADVSQISSMN